MPSRAHTRLLLAQLLAAGHAPTRRRLGRIPRPVQPTAIEHEYTKTLQRLVCEGARAEVERVQRDVIAELVELRKAQGRPIEQRADGGRGVMLALRVPPEVARRIALPGGETPEEMHVTLAYLGKAEALALEQLEALHAVAREVAERWAPLAGELSGLGRFSGPEQDALHALVDVVGLVALRQDVVATLRRAGVEPSSAHGFSAHVTLAYLDRDAPFPIDRLNPVPVRFGGLVVAIGGAWSEYSLRGTARADAARAGGLEAAAIEMLAGKIGRRVAAAAVPVIVSVIEGLSLAVGLGELVAVVLAVAAEFGLLHLGEKAGRAIARKAIEHVRSDAGEEEELGRRIGEEAARRLRATHGAEVLAQEAGGFNIGTGRAAQLGAKAAAEEEKRARAEAGEFGEEIDLAMEAGAKARRLIDKAAAAFAEKFRPTALYEIVKEFGKRTDRHSRLQLDRQLRAAIGVPFSAIERPTRDRVEDWIVENVGLIVTISSRYFDRLRQDINVAFLGGMHPYTFAEQIEARYEVSENDAERIARDQVLKLNSELTRDRMEGLGVEWAIWRTVEDGRVCRECESFKGKRFRLSEGINGKLPGKCHPQDRCWPEPDLDALING